MSGSERVQVAKVYAPNRSGRESVWVTKREVAKDKYPTKDWSTRTFANSYFYQLVPDYLVLYFP